MYLARVFGLYFIIAGVVIMFRRAYFMPILGGFVQEKLGRMIWGFVEMFAGLCLVVAHNDWSSPVAGIITFIGWAAVIEGVFYTVASDKAVKWVIDTFNVKAWYIGGGIFSIVTGVYLAGNGFGWM